MENFGIDIVKQFNEINKAGGDVAARLVANPGMSNIFLNEAGLNINANLLNANANIQSANSSSNEKYFCRHCKKTFSSIFVLKSHCEEVHNEKVPLDFLEKFAEKFKNYYMEANDPAVANVENLDAEILDFSSKKGAIDMLKVKSETNLSQALGTSSPTINKLNEQSSQALQLEQLSQQLNIDPATLAQKMMEQNLAAAANFPQTFGIPTGLQNLQSLQGNLV